MDYGLLSIANPTTTHTIEFVFSKKATCYVLTWIVLLLYTVSMAIAKGPGVQERAICCIYWRETCLMPEYSVTATTLRLTPGVPLEVSDPITSAVSIWLKACADIEP